MARIQILQLPDEQIGDVSATPFILVFDQVQNREAFTASLNGLQEKTGARAALLFEETVEIPANDLTPYREAGPVQYHVQPADARQLNVRQH